MNKPTSELIALADRLKAECKVRENHPDDYCPNLTSMFRECETALRTAANQSGSERAGVDVWCALADDTSWVDGRDVVLLVNDMEVSARYCAGEWSSETPDHPREYDGAVWSCFDDTFQIEIEECSKDPREWSHNGATHWRRPAALATPPAQPTPAATHGKPDGAVLAKSVDADEEKELFAAVTKIDLAGAIKHLRNWAAYKANEHCQEYANLIEAQARLIAWFVKERAVKAEAKSVAWRVRSYLDQYEITSRAEIATDWRTSGLDVEPLYTHPTTKPEAPAVSVDAESIHQLIYKDTHNALEGLVPDTFLSGELWIATQKAATAIAALIAGDKT